ncbi:hypothetical protein KY290_014709 [Solanum tuberosum]|uniref:NB-ARC domain containing protein n=1 Tax=Solanum tuberosum TaxID=4113 RepID=A0ABQ7VS51_SOLTU|nr:hypothetical protein KY290_014709 [Solanum tuberosum]
MASAVGQPLDVDRATYDKTRPNTTMVKVERCKHQGHREADCRTLTDGQVNAMVSENHIEGEKFQGDLRDHLNAKKTNLNRLKIGEMDKTVKDLDVGAEKNGVQDQNLVRQNSGQRLSKAMLDDYSSGNQMLSLIPQTGESLRQSCNSVDRVGVEKQLVVHSNQQNNKSNMRQSDKHTLGELHDALQAIKPDVQLENLAIDGKEKIAESEYALGVEKELESINSNPSKEKNLVRADLDSNIQSVSTPVGVCSMRTEKYDNVMSPTVAKAIQESQAAMLLKPNSAIKSPIVTLSIFAHEVASQNLDSPDEHQGKFGQLLSSTWNDKILAKGMSPLSQANFTNDLLISKEKQQGEMSTPGWADLVDEEELVSPPLLNRKLCPQALEFVPKSTIAKKNEQEALASGFSPINSYASDLGDDSFDEDEDEDMLDICFDTMAKDGDISPRHQRSGSNKNKKKTHGRQHSWDSKVTGEFVPRHLPMRLTKQNHMTVSIASRRSNTFKKQ